MTARDSAEELLAGIDDTLDNWVGSGDAMHWSPEPDIPPATIHATRLLGEARLIHVPNDMTIEHIVVRNTHPVAGAARYESAWDSMAAFRRVPLREPVQVKADSTMLLGYDSATGEASVAAVYDRAGVRVHVDPALRQVIDARDTIDRDRMLTHNATDRERNARTIAAAFGVPLHMVYP